ncbi:MAG: hypothetical protein IPK63_19025 [Candidatus Competibacteraceae bacterium]|nr:hypothetical protein [Candidatus Competibacteraceae bacterium]
MNQPESPWLTPTAKRSPPPSNPVAEAAIIAGLVNCGDPAEIGVYALDHRLALDCFTLPAYRNAYDAILELAADGQPVDIAIIAQRLDAEDLAAVDSACQGACERGQTSASTPGCCTAVSSADPKPQHATGWPRLRLLVFQTMSC